MINDIILLKLGEIVLKGLNRRSFEQKLIGNINRRLSAIGKFKVYCMQSTIYVEPVDETSDMDAAFEALGKVFGIATMSRAAGCEKDAAKIAELAISYLKDDMEAAKSFKVEGKRSDKSFPVTSIELSRPTNKDGSFVPAYVGKSLKLTAKVNSDATNKKLNWGVCYYNGDPEGEFDWELDGDKLEELNWNDNTTVKNGVLKIDKSWYSHGRCYAVFASSQDGNYMSDPIFIQAYGMTGSIEIWSAGEFNVNKDGYELLDKINNHTITIMPGEEVEFAALVYDVAGNIIDFDWEEVYDEVTGEYIPTVVGWNNHGANPDVKWTISGNKGCVDFVDTFEGAYDTMNVVGVKPGTVTVKVSANDGSKKTATFKIEVGIPPVTEAPGPQ